MLYVYKDLFMFVSIIKVPFLKYTLRVNYVQCALSWAPQNRTFPSTIITYDFFQKNQLP